MPQKLHDLKRVEKTRRILRRKQTKPEILLWSRLRNRRLCYKFKRQHSVGPYIVDFYCGQFKLAIEVDGPHHFETERMQQKDKIRQKFLTDNGLLIMRFTSYKVMQDVDTVAMEIKIACDKLTPSTAPVPSSSEEGNAQKKSIYG